MSGSPATIVIQSVLYCPLDDQLDRFIEGIGAATAALRIAHPELTTRVLLGDCSPQPSLTGDDVASITNSLSTCGVADTTYLPFGRNLGSGAGHNALLAEADSEAVLIVNPDAYVSPDVLAELLIPTTDPAVGIVEGRQIPIEHPKTFDRDDGTTSWASTACALFRRSVFEKVGPFDADSFFLYCDDVDISWRARLAGYSVVHRPSARVFHDKRLNGSGILEAGQAEFYYSAEASLMMAWKYSRPDLVEQWSHELVMGGQVEHQRAVETFQRRQREQALPQPIDPSGTVAEFVGYNYAEHRFGVGG
jgi:hypothetical protein